MIRIGRISCVITAPLLLLSCGADDGSNDDMVATAGTMTPTMPGMTPAGDVNQGGQQAPANGAAQTPGGPATTSAPPQTSLPAELPAGGEVGAPTPAPTGMPMPMPAAPASQLGTGMMGGQGSTADQWFKADVTRDGQNYFLMANGWGPNFVSQSLTYNGTSFIIDSMEGSQGDNYEPASYPTVFCGQYSDSASKACGLPAAIDSLTSLRTGWRWAANGNAGEYNAAYDIWLANGPDRSQFSGFLMVWLRDPPRQQPAGELLSNMRAVEVANVPGTWDMWVGTVFNGVPIINYARTERSDSSELEFDVLSFIRDARERDMDVPGSHILSVAVGFEIWNGPVQNLESVDFYVDVQ